MATASGLFAPFPCTCLAFSNKPPQILIAHHLPPWALYLSTLLSGRAHEGSACQSPDPQSPFPGGSELGLLLNVTPTSNLMPPQTPPGGHSTQRRPSQPPPNLLPTRPSISVARSPGPSIHRLHQPTAITRKASLEPALSRRPSTSVPDSDAERAPGCAGRDWREGDPTPPAGLDPV